MSGQRHLRNTAVMIAAFAGVSLIWLAIDLGRNLVRPGWWLEALLYAGFLVAAFGLLKGSRLAWFASVLIFAGGLVAGLDGPHRGERGVAGGVGREVVWQGRHGRLHRVGRFLRGRMAPVRAPRRGS